MTEAVLIVDDEDSVRRTFHEWLVESGLDVEIAEAADAEAALLVANRQPIDLAILDWNLGAGNDGLQLLEDLYLFHPKIVAILITGYAHQATPLDAMRMGVRDYLDKNSDLDRDTFLKSVKRQLDFIRPAKRERQLHQSLLEFRNAVDKVLPLVQSAAALNDPVPLPEAVRSLLRFMQRMTGAREGVLLARSYDADRNPPEWCRVYNADGGVVEAELVPFAQSVAGTVISLQKPCVMNDLSSMAAAAGAEVQPFEQGKRCLLAAPLDVASGIQVVIELFDKEGGFTEDDQQLAGFVAEFGVELLRRGLAETHTQRLLFDAVSAALGATQNVAQTMATSSVNEAEQPAPLEVLDKLRSGLEHAGAGHSSADAIIRLAEAIRVLAARHGEPAIRHCIRLVEQLKALLDEVTDS